MKSKIINADSENSLLSSLNQFLKTLAKDDIVSVGYSKSIKGYTENIIASNKPIFEFSVLIVHL